MSLLCGCIELGVVTDGSSISVGKTSGGYLVDGKRLPDKGEGFMTREVWLARDNRFGTDEMIELVTGVARRLVPQMKGAKLVIGDMSSRHGGNGLANTAFHRSHQSGRDTDVVYPMRDVEGKPFEADAMHAFDGRGRSHDKSNLTLDVPRTWLLVKERRRHPAPGLLRPVRTPAGGRSPRRCSRWAHTSGVALQYHQWQGFADG